MHRPPAYSTASMCSEASTHEPLTTTRMNAPDTIATHPFSEAYFHDLAAVLDRALAAGEFYTASLAAETSEFVRFNRGKVRQPGSVSQCYLEIDLMQGRRHALQRLALCGNPASDAAAIEAAVLALRAALPALDDDPHLLYATQVHSTRSVRGTPLPAAERIIDDVLTAAKGHDVVGIYAGGPVMRGFANAAGQRNWHEATSFNLQWSLYHRADKAVKSGLSGLSWDDAVFAAKMQEAQSQLASMALPSRALAPGDYRVFLAPAAMEEIAGMLQWGAFSARALATRQSSLARMQGEHGLGLDERVTLREATAEGIATGFQSAGFIRPDRVALIDRGRLVGALTSPRTALEFGGESNGANNDETPEALSMEGGDLALSDALA